MVKSKISCLGLLTVLLSAAFPLVVAAQEPISTSLGLAVLQEPPADLSSADFEVRRGDQILEVEALERTPERRILIYIDFPLSSSGSAQRAVSILSAEAVRLTSLGPVEIVRADPQPRQILPPTRDATAVEAALSQMAFGGEHRDSLREIRKRQYAQLRPLLASTGSRGDAGEFEALERAMNEEARLLTRQQDYYLSYLASAPLAGAQGLAFWVTDGFDLDPYTFYVDPIGGSQSRSLRSRLAPSPLPAVAEELGKAMSSLGWAFVAVSVPETVTAPAAGLSDYQRFKDSTGTGSSDPAPKAFISTTLEGIRRKLNQSGEAAEPEGPLLVAPRAPLDLLAGATAGAVVAGAPEMSSFLDSLARRYALQIRVPPGESHEITVRSRRSGLQFRAPRWIGTSLPSAVSAARVRRLLAGDLEGGHLDLVAAVRRESPQSGTAILEARADLGVRFQESVGGGPEGPAELRITLAPGDRQGPATLQHGYQTVENPRDPWSYSQAVASPEGADRIALIVEDLNTGFWGGTLAALVEGGIRSLGDDGDSALERALAEAEFLPKVRAVRLVQPDLEVFQGRVQFRARALRKDVREIAFFLDGKEVARRSKPPYEARIRLGRLPRPRTLRVVGYGADGGEVGDDVLRLNETGGAFRVRIISPEGGEISGAVDVQVSANLPQDHRLDRMEFSFNERTVATLYAPPFRQRMVIPEGRSEGFIRVVAHLDDGRFAEDVVFLGDQDFTDQVRVRLVELYTVVTDRQGRPVRGLEQNRFVVLEEGEKQEIAQFSDAGDLPVTLGLNIDSSASMFVKLPIVQEAASDFVRGFLSGRDRAFLVDFDTEPRLARDLTGDLRSVIHSIHRLRPGGDTHLWESIVFSLVELQGATGKKALVVFSDGAQEEEALSFKVCHDFAQRLGIPIYLIVLHPGIARGDDLTSSMKSFTRKLGRLTEDTGGRVYYLANTKNLETIYQEIDDELRSQYLLAYYTESGDDKLWRPVKVQVEGRGLEARTITGYYPTN